MNFCVFEQFNPFLPSKKRWYLLNFSILKADPKQHTLAKYFMELSLHCAEFSPLDPSYLAACSLCLSFKLLKGTEWNRTMEFYSTYKLDDLYSGMHKLAKLVLKSSDADYRYRVSYKNEP